MEAWKHGSTNSWNYGIMESWKHRNHGTPETGKHKNIEAQNMYQIPDTFLFLLIPIIISRNWHMWC